MKKEKNKEKDNLDKIEGLNQIVKTKNADYIKLSKILSEKDFWQTNGKNKKTILTHEAVKKIADLAGINKAPEYTILTQPDAYNNYQYTIQAKICDEAGKNCVVEIGEANRSNLGSKGRGNPANMAQKRAYDRAVLRFCGITGLLSEEELSDEETEDKMEGLNHDEKKKIAPIINQLLLAKKNKELILFNRNMKEKAKELNPAELDYVRKLYKKKVSELSKTSF